MVGHRITFRAGAVHHDHVGADADHIGIEIGLKFKKRGDGAVDVL